MEGEQSNLCSHVGTAPSIAAQPSTNIERVLPDKGISFPFPAAMPTCLCVAGACTQEFCEIQLRAGALDARRVLDAGRFGEVILVPPKYWLNMEGLAPCLCASVY